MSGAVQSNNSRISEITNFVQSGFCLDVKYHQAKIFFSLSLSHSPLNASSIELLFWSGGVFWYVYWYVNMCVHVY